MSEETVLPSDAACGHCKQLIETNAVVFQGVFLHADCLVCDQCGVKLEGKIFIRGDKRYCGDDFLQLFSKQCHRCGERSTGSMLEVGGFNFHPQHFTCFKCNQLLSAGNFLMDTDSGEPSCLGCQGMVCPVCNLVIAEGNYFALQTDNAIEHFHEACHCCSVCRAPFTGGISVIFHEKTLFCEPDFKKSYPQVEVQVNEQPKTPIAVEPPAAVISEKKTPPLSRAHPQEQQQHQTVQPSNSLSVVQETITQTTPGVFTGAFLEMELSESQAEILLQANGGPKSFFVYQKDSGKTEDLALVMMNEENKVNHFAITRDNEKFSVEHHQEKFDSVEKLVEHYRDNAIVDQTKLGEAVEFTELKAQIATATQVAVARHRELEKKEVPKEEEEENEGGAKASAEDLAAWARKKATCDLLIQSAQKLEKLYANDPAKLAAVRRTLAQAQAQAQMLSSMLEPDSDPNEFEAKDKFKNKEFFQSALASLDAQLAQAAAELEQLYKEAEEKEKLDIERAKAAPEPTAPEVAVESESTFTQLIQEYWTIVGKLKADAVAKEALAITLAADLFPYKKQAHVASFFKDSFECKKIRGDVAKKGGFDLETFSIFCRLLFDDVHILNVFKTFARSSPDMMTIIELKSFLTQQQRLRNIEPVLQIYYSLKGKVINNDKDDAAVKAFGRYLAVTHEGNLTVFGFCNLLHSQINSIFNEKHNSIYQDMSQPLAHYFIDSSHNTYLEGDQLRSSSTTDAYKKVLQAGCRCIELDLWDGSNNMPVIYHGHTLTSKVRALDVLETIAKYAFEASPYPVILSLENHLSLPQQKIFAQHMHEVFAAGVVPSAENDSFWDTKPTELPSPEQLKFKILVKHKAHPVRNYSAQNKEAEKKTKIVQEISDMVVYCKSKSHESIEEAVRELKAYEMMSCAEKKGFKLVKTVFEHLNSYTNARLIRMYPDGLRFDSSNYDPIPFWNAGCQMVALNYQKPDRAMQLADAKFRQNGRCGYVLKPQWLRDPLSSVSNMILSIKLLSGFNITHPKRKRCLPFVEIEIVGLTDHTATSAVARQDSGAYQWNEMFTWDIHAPELALIRFTVMDEYLGNKDPIGTYTIPAESLCQGYRYVPISKTLPFRATDTESNTLLLINVSVTVPPNQGSSFRSLVKRASSEDLSDSGTNFKKALERTPSQTSNTDRGRQKFDDDATSSPQMLAPARSGSRTSINFAKRLSMAKTQ